MGSFERPWFSELLFSLKNISINSLDTGHYSNGEKFDKLAGPLSLIPISFIVAKDINIQIGDRDTSKSSSLDTLKAGAEVGVGPFKASVSHNNTTKNSEG